MSYSLADLLATTAHRPYPLPAGGWRYYQEWNEALFLHWRVPLAVLRPLVPAGLDVDTFEGEAWVSVVGFTMQRIRPRYLPALPAGATCRRYLPALAPVSDFHEINLRTYVVRDGRAGVYFLSIEAQKRVSCGCRGRCRGCRMSGRGWSAAPGTTARTMRARAFGWMRSLRLGKLLTPLPHWING